MRDDVTRNERERERQGRQAGRQEQTDCREERKRRGKRSAAYCRNLFTNKATRGKYCLTILLYYEAGRHRRDV